MGLFHDDTVKIYEAKGKKAEWKSVRSALKEAGLTGVKTGVWQDEPAACGCGAHLDARDFGPNGKIDRDIYSIRVRKEDAEKAEQIVRKLVPDYSPYEANPDRFRYV